MSDSAPLDDDAIRAAAARWPGLEVEPDDVRGYAERCGVATPSPEALEELVLASRCSAGDPTALALFDARYLDAVPVALAHMKLSAERVDDIRQRVRTKLLVAEPGRSPRLDDYAGQGRLRGLVKVIGVRMAISALRKEAGHVGDAPLERLADAAHDPELRYMKERYRAAFRVAFEQAVRRLSSRERNILRLQLDAGLTVEQIGEVYGVHRATATRWLTKIRDQLMSDTRRELGERVGVSSSELDGVMELIQSRLDVSVRRMLETITPSETDAPSSAPDA